MWHRKTAVQAAIVAGVFGVLVAIIQKCPETSPQRNVPDIGKPADGSMPRVAEDLPSQEKSRFDKAHNYQHQHEYNRALEEIKPLVEKYPASLFLRLEHGRILYNIPSRRADALGEFLTAKQLDPASISVRYNLALTYANLNRIQEAQEEALWVYQHDKTHMKAALLLSELAYDDKKYKEARNYLMQVVQSNKDFVAYAEFYLAKLELVDSRTSSTQKEKAIEWLRKSVSRAREHEPMILQNLLTDICNSALNGPLSPLSGMKAFKELFSQHARACGI